MIEVVAPGPFATIQDLGRIGRAAFGVPRSGAFDRRAHELANRLVGNAPAAATIEFTLGGLTVSTDAAATIAVTGARCPGPDWGTAISVPAGSRLTFGAPPVGLRSYLAVRGGFAAHPVLGSRSTDTLSRLGPSPLQAGDRFGLSDAATSAVLGEPAVESLVQRRLSVVVGPRLDWFDPAALDLLTTTAWAVRPDSDRIGVRLDGPRLQRTRTAELTSEPTLPGALQVPPDGRPILLGPDAPVTGGYPVIAVVRRRDVDAAAQLRPGDTVNFTR